MPRCSRMRGGQAVAGQGMVGQALTDVGQHINAVDTVKWLYIPFAVVAFIGYIISVAVSFKVPLSRSAMAKDRYCYTSYSKEGGVSTTVVSREEAERIGDMSKFTKCSESDFTFFVVLTWAAILLGPLILASIVSGIIYKIAIAIANPVFASGVAMTGMAKDAIFD
jgi:hypothetical protein